MNKKNSAQQQPEILGTSLPEEGGKYAQLVTTVTNQYDATLIFFQIQPQQVGLDDNGKPKIIIFQKEISRVTIPLKALEELHKSIGTLTTNTTKNKGTKTLPDESK